MLRWSRARSRTFYVVEGTFCGLFWACERFHDVARAEQWVAAAESLQRRNLVGVAGFCRAHYGGILTTAGRWADADKELSEAVRLFERGYAALKASVDVRLAELRVLQGRLDEAEYLLEGVGEHPDAARPRAMLHLAQGRPEVAREVLTRRLDEPDVDHDVAAPLWGVLADCNLPRTTQRARRAPSPSSTASRSSARLYRSLSRRRRSLADAFASAGASSRQLPASLKS